MTAPYYADDTATLHLGDATTILRRMPDASVDCIVTSPPYYGQRHYGHPDQYGLEPTPAEYVANLRRALGEARRVLAKDGTLWLNLGDTYNSAPSGQNAINSRRDGTSDAKQRTAEAAVGRRPRPDPSSPAKALLGMPWRVALALQDDGWILRNDVIWAKTNPMPESVTDRLSSTHEHVFLLSKSERYRFDLDAIREPHTAKRVAGAGAFGARDASHPRAATGTYTGPNPLGRNPGDVWRLATRPYPEAHFATYPIDLPIRCITAGCRPGGVVLDPFSGSGTTGDAARRLGRRYIGIDLVAGYHDLAVSRFAQGVLT